MTRYVYVYSKRPGSNVVKLLRKDSTSEESEKEQLPKAGEEKEEEKKVKKLKRQRQTKTNLASNKKATGIEVEEVVDEDKRKSPKSSSRLTQSSQKPKPAPKSTRKAQKVSVVLYFCLKQNLKLLSLFRLLSKTQAHQLEDQDPVLDFLLPTLLPSPRPLRLLLDEAAVDWPQLQRLQLYLHPPRGHEAAGNEKRKGKESGHIIIKVNTFNA